MEKSFALILDSSVYKQAPKLNSELFVELVKYCRMGRARLYIPEVVEQEYLTWIKKEVQDAYADIKSASESLNKFYEPPSLLGVSMNFFATTSIAASEFNEVFKKVYQNWIEFKTETNAIVLPIKAHHGKRVMESYFNGQVPFKSLKNRSDIPDAFIHASLLDVLTEEKEMVFLSQDKAFTSRISDPRIHVFESLANLFSQDKFSVDEKFFSNLKEGDRFNVLFQYFKEDIVQKSKRQVNRSDLLFDMEQDSPDDTIGEFKEAYSEVEKIDFEHGSIRTISSLSYLIPFSARVKLSVSSDATPEELKQVAVSRRNNIDEGELGESGRYSIKEVYWAKVTGNLSIRFADSDPILWKAQVDKNPVLSIFAEKSIPEIVVSLEDIEKAP